MGGEKSENCRGGGGTQQLYMVSLKKPAGAIVKRSLIIVKGMCGGPQRGEISRGLMEKLGKRVSAFKRPWLPPRPVLEPSREPAELSLRAERSAITRT